MGSQSAGAAGKNSRYEYTENDIIYGVGPRLVTGREQPQTRRAKRPAARDFWARKLLLLLMAATGLICVAMIVSMSHAALIQREINLTVKETLEIRGEIETLQIMISSAVNIETVEKRALEMGMVYPSPEQFVYLRDEIAELRDADDFAQYIKENAYDLW